MKPRQVLTDRQSQAQFEKRIEEILAQARRLKVRQKAGFGYAKIWRREAAVQPHTRSAHWAIVPIKR